MKYKVTFSYSIKVKAKDEEDAEYKAVKEWEEIDPMREGVNIKIKEVK